MVIVDTTVWVDYLRGISNTETDWLDGELDRQRLAITDLILCEVLRGVRNEKMVADVERQLRKLHVFEAGTIELSREAPRNHRTLRRRGAHRPEDHRLSYRHVLPSGAAFLAASGSRFRSV